VCHASGMDDAQTDDAQTDDVRTPDVGMPDARRDDARTDARNDELQAEPGPIERRSPTAAEARALGHPTRMRIVFACRDRAMTNKELAAVLDTTPGTIHYHLRPLVEEGFLHPEEPRPGPRGSREQPYRATGKSWQIGGDQTSGKVLREVGVQEVLTAAEEDVLHLSRLGLTLRPTDLAELSERLSGLLEEAKRRSLDDIEDDDEVERVAIFVAVHRQHGPS
jgi:DNA-binding transcriptional ArsR family regulator